MSVKKLIPLLLCTLILPVAAQAKRIAIIKADDVRDVHPKWERFFKMAVELDVPVSAGVIAVSFEKQDERYDEWLKKWEATGKVEFWNHGWDHRMWEEEGKKKSEFGGSGYDHQKKHLTMVQAAAKEALGKPFNTFGSGFNAMDSDTAKALNEIPELKMVFCYPGAKPTKEMKDKILLPMTLRGENDGTGKPNFAKFKEEYEKKKSDPSLTLAAVQFHPAAFSEDGFKDFRAIVEFLKAEGWTFMLPSGYAASLEGK
jgi:peptidoglycan/xylan/chitin deacetylase (PgdA/CDA1 family)